MSSAETPGRFTGPSAAREIARSWEAFVSSGELIGPPLRPLIEERWRTCRELGIDPSMRRAPTVLSPPEIATILAREDLGRAGRSVLESFGRVVEGTGHVIVLADAAGRILHAAGHSGIQRTLEEVNLAPGGLWSEEAVGPNGIGTPIALGRPEVVFGMEHYCQGWQPFFCCGSPVRDPATGRILGGVDITGPVGKAHPMSFALTLSIAGWVEQNLSVIGLKRRNSLLQSLRGIERRWPAAAGLLVAEDGTVVDMNPAAARVLGLPACSSPQAPLLLSEISPELSQLLRQALDRGVARAEPLVFERAGTRTQLRCSIEPVAVDGRAVGMFVALSERTAAAGARPPLRPAPSEPGRGAAASQASGFAGILGNAPPLEDALRLARAVARSLGSKPVLVLGESGTGKEVISRAMHAESERAQRAFIAVNCSALPRELVESELFGYATGAFTGARREGQAGKFEAAQGGTILLDEIDSMPMDVQAKLLRVIETGEVVRLGSTRAVALDFAIMAASGPDLRERVEKGLFRLDLFHRLSVVEIVLPPLRQRRQDISLLATAFLERECAGLGREPLVLSREAADRVVAYHWPGNVRELQNLCARWAMTVPGREIRPEQVPAHVRGGLGPEPESAGQANLRSREDAIIRQALLDSGGHVAEAARRLAINKTTIYRRMKRWGAPPGVAACDRSG
jgi:sigma-54 dependent transcriptional regulator, acetoin dehydrogenase operon transcriptional activator AcoR